MGLAAAEDAQAQNFGDYLCGICGTVDAMVGKLIGRQALGVERTKAFFVAEKRAAGHGHAAAEQNVGE